jgi:Spy/CpxP family protein refolding chaperone
VKWFKRIQLKGDRKMKKNLVSLTLTMLGIVLFASSSDVYANHGGHKAGYSCSGGWNLQEKIEHKVHFMKMHQEDIGLTDEQIETIIDLKRQAKKSAIIKGAEAEVLGIDFKAEMYNYPVDEAKMNAILDQKYEVKKSKTKELITIYAGIRNMLTEEQNDKMKEIWRNENK